jgi:hypothetical protein
VRYYIVVEGAASESIVYPAWIKYINPALTRIFDIRDTRNDAYYLISGDGYPKYLKRIESAIEDVNRYKNFDYLVVGVDSEDKSCHEKHDEINNFVGDKLETSELRIIVQHFCLETWALGNRAACRKNAQDKTLLEYRRIFNVRYDNPELLPAYKEMNRAQFAYSYLRAMIRDWYPSALYTKARPDVILEEDYFQQIKKRMETTGHIKSFQDFLEAFSAGSV